MAATHLRPIERQKLRSSRRPAADVVDFTGRNAPGHGSTRSLPHTTDHKNRHCQRQNSLGTAPFSRRNTWNKPC